MGSTDRDIKPAHYPPPDTRRKDLQPDPKALLQPTPEFRFKPMRRLSLRQLQALWKRWAIKNFGPSWQPVPGMPYRPLLGMGEELGELMHAHLKQEQGIRGTPAEHEAAAKDAIGDIMLYLLDYCNGRGWDAEEIILKTANEVLQRDWQRNKATGRPDA